jgi:hypothetical protein
MFSLLLRLKPCTELFFKDCQNFSDIKPTALQKTLFFLQSTYPKKMGNGQFWLKKRVFFALFPNFFPVEIATLF